MNARTRQSRQSFLLISLTRDCKVRLNTLEHFEQTVLHAYAFPQ
jgi:hypothetical protein